MYLYLFRHGVAEDATSRREDRLRELTPEGISRMKLQAAALQHTGLRMNRLFSSPYVRARQTADFLAPALEAQVEEEALLKSGCSFEDVVELLSREGRDEHVMIVGHQPDLGHIIDAFTGSVVTMRKGSMGVVEVNRLHTYGGSLIGLYDPDLMVQLGAALMGRGGDGP